MDDILKELIGTNQTRKDLDLECPACGTDLTYACVRRLSIFLLDAKLHVECPVCSYALPIEKGHERYINVKE